VVLVGAQSGNNLRDPRNDALKTLDKHKALLAAIQVGVDAAQINQFAQALVAAEKKKYDDDIKAWEAEEDRLRNERVAARKKALQEEEDRNDFLQDKLYCRKVPEVPAVLNNPLPMGEIFHVPQASLDKLALHQFTPLSLYLPETMDAYQDAVRNVTASNAIVPVLEDDGLARWVAQVNTLNPKKVIPDHNLYCSVSTTNS
jgi:di/tripeptidase